MLPDTGHG